jgi:hypothetical protein
MIRVFALLALPAVTVAGCSASRSLGPEDDGTRVALRSGDEIEITLAGNAPPDSVGNSSSSIPL